MWKFKLPQISKLPKPKLPKSPKIPRLRLRYRILLYIGMMVLAALSLINVAANCFPFIAGNVIYVLAACTLFPGMYYLVLDIRFGVKGAVHSTVEAHPYVNKVTSDYRLRTFTLAVPGVISNVLFAVFNGVVGIISRSAWFGSLAAYYILLSLMRLSAVRQERLMENKNETERMEAEIAVFRKDSILFIFLAIVLAGMVVLLEHSQGGKEYPGFTIYAAAAYTFYKLVMSSINIAKSRKLESPLLAIVRRIGYVDAYVSILILQTAMFAAFASEQEMFTKIMNAATGGFVCVLVLTLGIQGIYCSRKLKLSLKTGGNCND